ncbi:hypothetical protein TYRP_018880 [Tyrophagus putrescentiae]|nr:hypothetical protein TYRP_018880 [Tyrophagus putrescentiae]
MATDSPAERRVDPWEREGTNSCQDIYPPIGRAVRRLQTIPSLALALALFGSSQLRQALQTQTHGGSPLRQRPFSNHSAGSVIAPSPSTAIVFVPTHFFAQCSVLSFRWIADL